MALNEILKFWFLMASLHICLNSSSKLNVPRVLLPYYLSVPINFTLEVTDGCYNWRSSRPEVATVHAANVESGKSCSNQAIVSAVWKQPGRMTTIILAEETVTGQIFRCDIIVDAIHRLEIVTTTRELFIEDAPELFEVRAFNDQNDTFSSLEGLSFQWNLISSSDEDHAHSVLRILTFEESAYETPPYIGMLEKLDEQGHMILVEGIKTGSAKVSTKLRHKKYKHVNSVNVRLIVVANLMLNPANDVYLLQYANVSYKVELIKQGRPQQIPMPSAQYYLELSNTNIANLDIESSTVTGMDFGNTEIILKDRNINDKELMHHPTAMIYVVNPSYLGFVILPGKAWVLETHREYNIIVDIYDRDSHRVYPSDNLVITAKFSETHFNVLKSSYNGTHHYVYTKTVGVSTIQASLSALVHTNGKTVDLSPPVQATQDVEIFEPIVIKPPRLAFPWEPSKRGSYRYKLQASGGSGNFSWSSGNTSVVQVNVKGEFVTLGPGMSTVTAADLRHLAHIGHGEIYVLPPTNLKFLPKRVEAEVGTVLHLPLAMTAVTLVGEEQTITFDDCHAVPFEIHITDTTVFQHVSIAGEHLLDERVQDSCAVISVKALRVGNTEVVVKYSYGVTLSSVITIAAYEPLKLVEPEQVAVVTIGSSKHIVFEGGPLPWVLQPNTSYGILTYDKNELLSSHQVKAYDLKKNLHVFIVFCKGIVEQILKVTVGNHASSTNTLPAVSSAIINFVCAKPVSLHLEPLISRLRTDIQPCPIAADTDAAIPILCDRNFDVLAVVNDQNGRKFDNFSSLIIEWELDNYLLAKIGNSDSSLKEEGSGLFWQKQFRSLKTLVLKNKEGLLTVTAKIKKYKQDYFTAGNILYEQNIQPVLSHSLQLSLVQEALIEPGDISIFNHPSNKVTLMIKKGSSFFDLGSQEHEVAKVNIDNRVISVWPVVDGSFTLTVTDLCLESSPSATADVHVSGVKAVELNVIDKVELQSEVLASVSILDSAMHSLSAQFFGLMNLTVKSADDIISVRQATNLGKDKTKLMYSVKGLLLGDTSLVAYTTLHTGEVIYSKVKPLQVFPPLKLEPRNVTMLHTSTYQISSTGGPQPQAYIEFTIQDGKISSVDSAGIIEALSLGSTSLVGKAVDTETGSIYSQDKITINVVNLDGIRIYAPLTRMQTGTQMPVYAIGLTDSGTPVTFSSVKPPLTFHWHVNNREVAVLRSVYYPSGIYLPDTNNFAMRLWAKAQGRITLKLEVTMESDVRTRFFTDEVQIRIFEGLVLFSPELCTSQILITPNTETYVKTNRDSVAKLTFEILQDSMESSKNEIATVDKAGKITSGSQTGEASILIAAWETFGINQTLVIRVKVKPVSYLMINSMSIVHTTTKQTLYSLPIGMTAYFVVSYHDNIGQKFITTNIALKYRPDRYDLLQVSPGAENGTYIAHATRKGETILKVYNENNPRQADYVNVLVGDAIEPASLSINLGDIVCFHSPVVSAKGRQGQWSSEEGIMRLDKDSGVGVAVNIGNGFVAYTVSSPTDFATYTKIQVQPISSVKLLQHSLDFFTNVARKEPFSIPILLTSDKKKPFNVYGTNCTLSDHSAFVPYQCKLRLTTESSEYFSAEELFSVQSKFNTKSRVYECLISQVRADHLVQAISTFDTNVELHVRIPKQDKQPEVSETLLTLPFVPAFYVLPNEIHLSDLLTTAMFTVSAVDRVMENLKVTSSDSSIVEILPQQQDPKVRTNKFYPVRLIQSPALWHLSHIEVHIDVVSSLTKQHQIVPVKVKLMGTKPDADYCVPASHQSVGWAKLADVIAENYVTWFFTIIVLLISLAACYVGYRGLTMPRYYEAPVHTGVFLPRGSPVGSPETSFLPHGFTSPWASSPTAQGSPKSKLWSVGNEPVQASSPYQRQTPLNRSPYQLR